MTALAAVGDRAGSVVLCGSAHPSLAAAVAAEAGACLGDCDVAMFPDGERAVEVTTDVRDRDVVLVQPTGPPADRHLLELLLLADAVRAAGCRRMTAVVPYFGYARQDRREARAQALGARVVADALGLAALTRLLVVDPHSPAVEAMLATTVVRLSAVALLADALRPTLPADPVVVAPDLGAVKLADQYAAALEAPVAYVRKLRISGATVRSLDVVGTVAGRTPIVIDDMISTGATIAAAVSALQQAGANEPMDLAATHGLFVAGAAETLGRLPLRRVVVTDTLPAATPSPATHVVSVARLVGDALRGAAGVSC